MNTFKIKAALEYLCYDRFIFLPSDLSFIEKNYNNEPDILQRVKKCKIYGICSRPKIKLIPNNKTLKINNKMQCQYTKQGKKEKFEADFTCFLRASSNRSLEIFLSEYPHRNLLVKNNQNITIQEVPIELCVNRFFLAPEELSEFEILYIGKVTGRNGNKDPIQRLLNHSTLQKILSVTQENHPDKNIFCLLLNFLHPTFIFLNKPNGSSLNNRNDEQNRLEYLCKNKLDKKTYNQIVEGAIINYFKPTYNNHYKENFKNRELKTLEYLKNNSIESIFVNIDTSCINIKLKSQEISPKSNHHFERYLVDSNCKNFMDHIVTFLNRTKKMNPTIFPH